MNTCPAFPAAQFGLAPALMYRFVSYLALCIRASGLGMLAAMTSQTRGRIMAFAARLPAMTRTFARLAERARAAAGLRRASCGAPRAPRSSRRTFSWMEGFVPAALRDAVVAVIVRGKLATLIEPSLQTVGEARRAGARLWPDAAGRVFFDRAQTTAEAQVTADSPIAIRRAAIHGRSRLVAAARCERLATIDGGWLTELPGSAIAAQTRTCPRQ